MRSLIFLGTFLFCSHCVYADFIEVRLPCEERVAIEIVGKYNVKDLKDDIEEMFGLPVEKQLVLSRESPLSDDIELYSVSSKVVWVEMVDESAAVLELLQKGTHSGYRNYNQSLTSKEKKDISFILKNLARKSLVQLLKLKSKMKSAGDRIDQVHPLNFLTFIFTDEELKACVHAVKKRGGFLWNEFYSGLRNTLKEEADIGNLTDSMIHDFCNRLEVDSGIIAQPIQNREWDNLMKLLILHIPREDDSGHYDM